MPAKTDFFPGVANPSPDVQGSDLHMLDSLVALREAGYRVVVTLPEDGALVAVGGAALRPVHRSPAPAQGEPDLQRRAPAAGRAQPGQARGAAAAGGRRTPVAEKGAAPGPVGHCSPAQSIVCSNISKAGLRMSGGLAGCKRALAGRPFRAVAVSVFASGGILPREAIVFGASTRAQIAAIRQLVVEYWPRACKQMEMTK